MSARRGGGLPPGVRRRHARSCPAVMTDDMALCACHPRYQVQAGGRRDRRTRTFATVRDAQRWRVEVQRNQWKRGARLTRTPTVAAAAEAWLEAIREGRAVSNRGQLYRPRTAAGYARALRRHVIPVLGGRRLDDVTRGDLQAVIAGLQADGRAASTARNVIVPVQALYRYALDHAWTASDPTRRLPLPSLKHSRRERFATAEEARALLAALPERDRPVWATAMYAGLRSGELRGLRWLDVDLVSGELRVERSFDPTVREMADTKTLAGRRTVPIPGVLRPCLESHLARRDSGPEGLVFVRGSLGGHCRAARKAEPFSDQALGERAKRAWARAGLTPLGLHEARHTYASLMAAAGVPMKVLSELMGHSSIRTTMDLYAHLYADSARDAADRLDAHLGQGHPSDVVDLAAHRRRRRAG